MATLADGGAIVIGGQTGDDAALRLRATEIYRAGAFMPGPEMARQRLDLRDAAKLHSGNGEARDGDGKPGAAFLAPADQGKARAPGPPRARQLWEWTLYRPPRAWVRVRHPGQR